MAFTDAKLGLIAGLMGPSGGSFTGGVRNGLLGYSQGRRSDRKAAAQQERLGLLKQQAEQQKILQDLKISQWKTAQDEARQQKEQMGSIDAGMKMGNSRLDSIANSQLPFDLRQQLRANELKMQPAAPKDYTMGNQRFSGATNQPIATAQPQFNPYRDLVGPDGVNQPVMNAKEQLRIAGRNNVSMGNVTTVDTVKNSRDAYKDYRNDPQTKTYNDMRRTHAQMKAALGRKSGTGDLAAVVKLNKMLDPGSVVRESEVAMAMDSTGKLEKMVQYGRSLADGTKLTPAQRQEYMGLVNELMQGIESEQVRFHGSTRGRAQSFGMDANRIAPDLPKIDYDNPFGAGAANTDPATTDFSAMSDDELKAIIGGR